MLEFLPYILGSLVLFIASCFIYDYRKSKKKVNEENYIHIYQYIKERLSYKVLHPSDIEIIINLDSEYLNHLVSDFRDIDYTDIIGEIQNTKNYRKSSNQVILRSMINQFKQRIKNEEFRF